MAVPVRIAGTVQEQVGTENLVVKTWRLGLIDKNLVRSSYWEKLVENLKKKLDTGNLVGALDDSVKRIIARSIETCVYL